MAKWLNKYEQGGLVLKKKTKDNYGTKPNVNDVKVTAGPNFVGEGYTAYNWKSPAWGGQFQMGGSLPGTVGFMYARTQNPAPSNGKYAKKTQASAQNGIIVNDPNDPRLKKYQDSLNLYNKNKKIYESGIETKARGLKYENAIKGKPYGEKWYLEEGTPFNIVKKPTQPVEYQAPKVEVKQVRGKKRFFYNDDEVDEATFNKIVPKKGTAQNGQEMKFYQDGLDFKPKSISKNGAILDPMGQWAHPGEVTIIPSNDITMEGVDYPVLGISDTGDTKIMYPDQDYKFDGKSVTEYPMAQDGRNISNELKKQAEEVLAKRNINRNSISQYTPEPGEAERLDREKLQRIAENNAPLNKMAASKGAKNLQDAILFATNVMGAAEGAGALKGLLKKSPKFALAKAATTVEEDAAINAAKPSLAELWKKDEKIPTNYSGFTKEEVLKKAKNKNEITKLPDEEFKKTVLKPTGEISTYDEKDAASYFTGEDEIFPMTNQEYIDKFNSRLDLLNEIIEKNNKTGIPYSVNNLSDKGILMFNTPETPENMLGKTWFHTDITPGEWRGTVKDINNPKYLKSIPGLNMRDASMTVFGDGIPRRGTGTYKSINEYLRKLDLGRVKAGFNSQSDHAQTLWENAVKKGNAVGYFNDPNTIHAAMKKHGGWLNKYK